MLNKDKLILLAGKLANKAKLVIEADTKNLSWRVSNLELTLDEYNNYVLSFFSENKTKNNG